jgi:hypothetical protein
MVTVEEGQENGRDKGRSAYLVIVDEHHNDSLPANLFDGIEIAQGVDAV